MLMFFVAYQAGRVLQENSLQISAHDMTKKDRYVEIKNMSASLTYKRHQTQSVP